MATASGKTKEHAFKQIQRDIKDGNLGNLLLFYGEEEYLVRWAADTVIETYADPALLQLNCSKLTRETASPQVIMAQCETLPLLSEKRIVLVEGFPAGGESGRESYTEAEEKELLNYLKELPDSCILILIADSVDKRRKLYKGIAASGACYEFSRLDESGVESFIRKRFKQSGKNAGPGVIRHMMDMSGYFDRQTDYTLYNLENDIKKLIAYSDGDEIKISDLSKGLSGNTESYVFDMINALSRGDKGEALLLLHNLLSSGESVYKLLALICSHYETILTVKEMGEEGYGPAEIRTATGGNEYRIKIAIQLSGRYSLKQLRNILCSCFAVDKHIKTGLLEDRLAMEMLVAGIS